MTPPPSTGKRLELPEPDCMLPDALLPVADEWYKRVCERAGYVDRLTISGELVIAIKTAIGEPKYTPDQMLAYGDAREKAAREQAGEWLPIESAPRDGTRFIVWCKDGTFSSAQQSRYTSVSDDCTHWMIPVPPAAPSVEET